MKKFLVVIMLLSLTSICYADQVAGTKTVKAVFSEGGVQGGFTTNEGLPGCLYGIMYVDLSSASGRAQLAQVLTAKAAHWNLKRIDFTINASGVCSLSVLHVE